MSQTTGKTSTYIKNANVRESTQINTGFKKVRFLHQATAGDTLIQLGSLTAPTGAVNYSAPSPTDLAQTNLMQWPGNFELVSSISGRLIQNISYVVNGAATIKLLYSARDGEIFEGIIDYGARTGLTLVDAAPIVASGTLSAGSTDFNVGTPFQVGLYSSYQVGAVMVFVDRALQTRNTGNNAPGSGIDGDYYEVHSGAGLGTLIRFNTPDLVNDRQVMVISVNGLVERPSGSLMAVMEALQGQIDAIVPTVAALADVAETTFQGTPNNVDLKAFGDRVITLERILNLSIPINADLTVATALSITGSTTNPSKGTTTTDSINYYRDGQYMVAHLQYVQTAAGTAGSGDYLIAIPDGLTADTGVVPPDSTVDVNFPAQATLESNFSLTNTATTLVCHAKLHDSTHFKIYGLSTGGTDDKWGSTTLALSSTAVQVFGWVRIPILGWTSTQTVRQALGL